MKYLYMLPLLLLVIQGCGFGSKMKDVTIEQRYSMQLPESMMENKKIHADASLQYQDPKNEFYAIVIDENIEEMHKALENYGLTDIYPTSVDGYSKLLLEDSKKRIKIQESSDLMKTKINGMDARKIELSAKVDNMDIYYQIAYLQGKKTYYQIMIWTEKARKDKVKDIMKKMIESFKEK